MFGTTLGVVVGSVSVRDARSGCVPPNSPRGSVLLMNAAMEGTEREVASERVRFKVCYVNAVYEVFLVRHCAVFVSFRLLRVA